MSSRVKFRAVSPIIATLLLIFIAIVAALITYAWVTGYVGTMTTGLATPQDRIIIISAKITNDTNATTVVVTVQNVGQSNVGITAVFLYDVSNVELGSKILASPVSISSGSINKITAVINGVQVQRGKSYVVKVVTANGVEASYVAIAG